MSQHIVDAVFERGAFRLLKPIDFPLPEGQSLRLVVDTDLTPESLLTLAAEVYQGLTESEIGAIEEIALDRRTFFEKQP